MNNFVAQALPALTGKLCHDLASFQNATQCLDRKIIARQERRFGRKGQHGVTAEALLQLSQAEFGLAPKDT